jgi:hypothetical protein
MKMITPLIIALMMMSCSSGSFNSSAFTTASDPVIINSTGKTLETRIMPPDGYKRLAADSTSFTYFLRNLPLKKDGHPVMLYDGGEKYWQSVHMAVVDMEIGKKDLQQCADACIRMWAEYLWMHQRYDEIHFNLTNGFNMEYSKWRAGNRLQVDGNKTWWELSSAPSNDYASFRKYLDKVFMYAGTLSVQKEIKPVSLAELQAGDIFVIGGSPGHAAMVADVAVNDEGKKVFLLMQGYMPAQDIHVIKNPKSAMLSPWFEADFEGPLETMEWSFPTYTLGRF